MTCLSYEFHTRRKKNTRSGGAERQRQIPATTDNRTNPTPAQQAARDAAQTAVKAAARPRRNRRARRGGTPRTADQSRFTPARPRAGDGDKGAERGGTPTGRAPRPHRREGASLGVRPALRWKRAARGAWPSGRAGDANGAGGAATAAARTTAEAARHIRPWQAGARKGSHGRRG